MNALIMNFSPVRNGATAEIVDIISDELKNHYMVKHICIDDFNIAYCKGVSFLPYDSKMYFK